jgi:hypothetical protein
MARVIAVNKSSMTEFVFTVKAVPNVRGHYPEE